MLSFNDACMNRLSLYSSSSPFYNEAPTINSELEL
jgi:hypothetical protein